MIVPHPSGDNHYSRRSPELVLRGTAAPGAKLDPTEIAEIYALYDEGANKSELARTFGVSRITIWRHIKARDLFRAKE